MTTMIAVELAKRWMTGLRKMSQLDAWTHPERVAGYVKELLFAREEMAEYDLETFMSVAWLHDIIEDGVKEDGSPVEAKDLLEAGIPAMVVAHVVTLTHVEEMETKEEYLARLAESECPEVKVVKALDRVASLYEGKFSFGPKWAERYAEKTEKGVLPLAKSVPGPLGTEVTKILERSIKIARSL